MNTYVTFIVAVIATALASVARAAEGEHVHAKMDPAQAELGASAAFDASGVLWAVHKVSGHIAVSRSEDAGRSWSNPVLVTPAPEPTDTGSDARPKIALGARGEIYLTWTKPLAQPYTGEIKFTRSLDGGRTFSTPIVVHHDRQIITHRFDTIAVNAKGQLFVAWIDKRDLTANAAGQPTGAAYAGAALYFAVSDDRGATFRGDFKVIDHCCECCRIALVAQSDGSVSAMWRHIFEPNIRDHAVATLFSDGKAGPVRRVSFEDWRIDACPHHGPAMAAMADGRLHAVWFSAAPDKRGVFYGLLSQNGAENVRRIGPDSAVHADIAVSGHRVAVTWKAFADGKTKLQGMISDDDGHTWREVEIASVDGPSDYPRVLVRDGRFLVFWHTRERPLSVTAIP